MELFHRMAYLAAAKLLGASASRRISNEQLSAELEAMALSDPDLAEHYARLAEALPAMEVQRAIEDEDVELDPARRRIDRPRAA